MLHRMALQVIQVHLVTIISLLFSLKGRAASTAKPGCPETCGNVGVVYPFGIGEGCYLDKPFEILCHGHPGGRPVVSDPRPFLRVYSKVDEGDEVGNEVLSMSVTHVRVMDWSLIHCYSSEIPAQVNIGYWTFGGPFIYSHTGNKLVVIGCNVYAYVGDSNSTDSSVKTFVSGCVSICNDHGWSWLDGNYSCSGIGCCQADFPYDIPSFNVRYGDIRITDDQAGDRSSSSCYFIFMPENNFTEFQELDISFHSDLSRKYYYPAVLNWEIGNFSCHEAQRRGDYACGRDSHCVNSRRGGGGYTCVCKSGYIGNPYLPDGCVDVDECKEPNLNRCLKGHVCVNTNGSYHCDCPPNYYRVGDKREFECILNREKLKAVLFVSLGIGVTIVLLILVVIGFWLNREIEKRKEQKVREKFFRKNGGRLLQQQISSSSIGNGFEKTKLYTLEELDKATDNFNAGRVLGKGGRGRVYKGMLLDGSIVAIKKSIVVNEKQVAEFINEVFILSQINHRHIVKLLGCCLESEVPLLVYEYISNKTLAHHLYKGDHASKLSWEMRLKVAFETAGALAYLHSYSSTAILHRDMKSGNILLDENFRAVVSDFGLSRSISHEKTHLSTLVQGTFGYLDPEYFRTGQFTDKSDVYGFGVILAELLTGEKVICSSRSEESLAIHFRLAVKNSRLFEIVDKAIVTESKKNEILAVANMAKRCLKLSGKKRPTMKEIEADLYQLRKTKEQPPLHETCHDHCCMSLSNSISSVSTSAVTEERACAYA